MLLFLLLVVVVSAVGGLWPALAAAIGGFLLVNWYFIPPLYTFTIGEGENILALAVFLAVAVVVSGFVALAARRAVEGRRARAEAEALAPPRRLVARVGRARQPAPRARARRRRRAPPHGRAAGGSRPRAAIACRRAPRRARWTIELDDEHVLALAGAPIRSEDQRVLDAFAKELAASVELGELEAEAETAGTLAAANELRAALLSAVSHDLRTPIAAIKASVTSLLQDDVDWTPEARQRVPADDRRGDRPAERARRQPARHEPPPGRRARDQRRRRSASRRCCRPRSTASASATARSSSTSRSRSRACSPTPGCSSGRSRT